MCRPRLRISRVNSFLEFEYSTKLLLLSVFYVAIIYLYMFVSFDELWSQNVHDEHTCSTHVCKARLLKNMNFGLGHPEITFEI